MRLTEHPAELRIRATTMIPLIPNQEVRVSGTDSQCRREPKGRKIVAHGAQPWVAGGRRLPAPERGVKRGMWEIPYLRGMHPGNMIRESGVEWVRRYFYVAP